MDTVEILRALSHGLWRDTASKEPITITLAPVHFLEIARVVGEKAGYSSRAIDVAGTVGTETEVSTTFVLEGHGCPVRVVLADDGKRGSHG